MVLSTPPIVARRGSAGPAILAAALAGAAWALGLHGTDLAAQVHRVDLFRGNGPVLWDPDWYSGSYPPAYSVLGPAVAAGLSIPGSLALAAAGAAWCFAELAPEGAWYFSACTAIAVVVGQLPYLLGEALGLAAILAVARHRTWLAVPLAIACGLCSPLAGAFLVLGALLWAWGGRADRRGMLATAAAAAAPVAALGLAFPADGPFPFPWTGLAVVEALCAAVLAGVVPGPRRVAVVYGLAALAAFVVADPVGGNATRLAATIGVPLLVATARRATPGAPAARIPRRAVGLLALVPFAVWQWAVLSGVQVGTPVAETQAFYRPLVARIRALADGAPVRVEVVPTRDHWESVDVPGDGVVLARGWERQLDVLDAPLFYRPGALDAATYRTWLDRNGVTLVALAATPLDYAGRGEAALLRAGVPGLVRVWSSPDWTLWRVDGSPGILSGPGRLVTLAPDRVVVDALRPGPLLLRVRFPRYRCGGAASTTPAGWTEIHARRAGPVVLHAGLLCGPG